MERESFIFYQSFRNATKHLPNDNQKNALVMIVEYGVDWKDPDPKTDPIAYAIFLMAKPQLDKNNQRFINGSNWWKPVKTKKEPKRNQNVTEHEPNVNVNDNENVKELEEFVLRRNSVKDFWVAKKGLPKVRKITSELKRTWQSKRKEYTADEIINSIESYCNYMAWVKPKTPEDTFYKHRFTFSEFLSQRNGLAKYINFIS